jgi:hypothetical protein
MTKVSFIAMHRVRQLSGAHAHGRVCTDTAFELRVRTLSYEQFCVQACPGGDEKTTLVLNMVSFACARALCFRCK